MDCRQERMTLLFSTWAPADIYKREHRGIHPGLSIDAVIPTRGSTGVQANHNSVRARVLVKSTNALSVVRQRSRSERQRRGESVISLPLSRVPRNDRRVASLNLVYTFSRATVVPCRARETLYPRFWGVASEGASHWLVTADLD